MGKIIDAATWLGKKWKQARDRWESQKKASPGSSQQQQFTWLPKAMAMRVALAILLATTYFQSLGHNAAYTVLWGFFLITTLRYGWFLLTQSPIPDLRRDWWRNPGVISLAACVLIYAVINSNPERIASERESFAGSSSRGESNEELDARLLRNFERAMGESTSGSNNSSARGGAPSGVGPCSSCGRKGTISTGSGHTIVCPDCGGRGYTNGASPRVFPKYGQ